MRKWITCTIMAVMMAAMIFMGTGNNVFANDEVTYDSNMQTKKFDVNVKIGKDGSYTVYVKLLGGTGKASVASPASVSVEDGQAYAQIVFSSKHYDYMLVDGVKYMDESVEDEEENSTFTIPIDGLDCELDIVADTTAMSVPVSYTHLTLPTT